CIAVVLFGYDSISGGVVACEEGNDFRLGPGGDLIKPCCLSTKLDRLRVDQIQARAAEPNVVANLPGEQRMLFGWIVAEHKNRRSVVNLAHAGRRIRFSD